MSPDPSETREIQFRNSSCPRYNAKTRGFRPIATRPALFDEDEHVALLIDKTNRSESLELVIHA